MKFVLRDDDPCALTRPEELERCYASIWDELPICLSVTPFRALPMHDPGAPGQDVPLAGGHGVPLEQNRELVAFLRDGVARGRFQIALHGYHHDMPDGQPEYVAGRDLARKTIHGKQYVEALLGCRISTFVPPNNSLSRQGFGAVIAAGLNVISRQNYSRMNLRALDPPALLELAVTVQYSLRNRIGRLDAYSVRRYPRYQQACYFTAGPAIELSSLLDSLRSCPRAGGVFVLATHYHAFERRMRSGESIRDAVFALIDEARRIPGTEFVGYDALWSRRP